MTARPWKFDEQALLIAVRASPKASRDAIEGVRIDGDGQAWLQVKVRAVPESIRAFVPAQRRRTKPLSR